MLVLECEEGVELLASLVVREVRLLDYQLLKDSVRFLIGGDGPRDAAEDLEQ